MNRAQAVNPFTRLIDVAAQRGGEQPLASRTSGASSAATSPVVGTPLTTAGDDGKMTWTALTEMDVTDTEGPMTI